MTLPSTTKQIGTNVFANCINLFSVTLSSSVEIIGEGAFDGCKKLQFINLEDTSIEKIPNFMFSNCTSLETIKLPSTLTEIGTNAFRDCSALDDILDLSVCKTIYGGAFQNCTSLDGVVFNDYYNLISANCFAGCTSLSDVSLKNVRTIGNNAFKDCKSLTHITIPESVESIHPDAFYGCTSLEKVEFAEDGYMVIGPGAFANCALKTGFIPSYVEEIGAGVFEGNNQMTTLSVPFIRKDKSGAVKTIEYFFCMNYERGRDVYLGTIPKGLDTIYITDEFAIANTMFANCQQIKHLYILSKLSTIPNGVFKDCENLETLTISGKGSNNNGTCASTIVLGRLFNAHDLEYENHYLYVPTTLKSVTMTDVDIVAPYTFYKCAGLEEIIIQGNTLIINENAFYGCNIESIILPDTLEEIEMTAFYDCANLKEITIPQSVQIIGEYAFDVAYIENIIFEDENDWTYYDGRASVDIDVTDKETLLACIGLGYELSKKTK